MAMTLLQQGQFASSGEQLAVINELSAGDLLQVMPFRSIDGNSIRFRREEALPDVNFRNINSALQQSYGEVSLQSEALHLYGGDLRVDQAILQLEGSEAMAWNIQARVRAMRMDFERCVIKGSEQLTNGLEFNGLQSRITRETSQYVNNAGSLETNTKSALSFQKLDELIDTVDATAGDKYLIMSKKMRRALTAGSRDSLINGGINILTDGLGRQRMMYGDVPILIVDRDSKNIPILSNTETDNSSSIYCVSFGDTDTVGIQNGSIGVRNLGESTAKPEHVVRIEWYCGMAVLNGRSVGRLAMIDDGIPAVA